MQSDIETKVIETIARRQPLAVDLRELVGAFHIVKDLERIGDLAKSICKRTLVMDSALLTKLLRGIRRVSVPVLNQLGLVLDSYAERDAAKALSVWSSDEEIWRPRCTIAGAADPYVGGSPQYCVLRASFVLFQKLGANGRSHDQHRRIRALYGYG
jgi:hypothetical protein